MPALAAIGGAVAVFAVRVNTATPMGGSDGGGERTNINPQATKLILALVPAAAMIGGTTTVSTVAGAPVVVCHNSDC